jgi:Tfp pilus assembly protein PilF
MTEKYLRIFVALMLVGIMLTACGGSDETPPSTEPPATPSKPAATPTLSAADHAKLGMEHYEAGEMEEALAEFQTAVDLDPNDFEAYRNLGSVYSRWKNSRKRCRL